MANKVRVKLICLTMIAFTINIFTLNVVAQRYSQSITLDNHKVFVTEWQNSEVNNKAFKQRQEAVVLLSGPTDNWNSDSAWFARLAPKLTEKYRVISIDRAGQLLSNPSAPVGYAHFGKDLALAFEQLKLDNIHIVAFASANIALLHYFALKPSHQIQSITMIDPDVLTEYSIKRYKKDAYPFKKNLVAYSEYIAEGKYNERAKQKNELDLKHLKSLALDDKVDWEYVEQIFEKRLNKINLQNLFKEIGIYDQDLDSAISLEIPTHLKLSIIDTNFEQSYIDQSENQQMKKELEQWQADGKNYYQSLIKKAKSGQYIPIKSQEHLVPFSDPSLILKILNGDE